MKTYPRCATCNTVGGFVNRLITYPTEVGNLVVCEWCERTFLLEEASHEID
jgi:hypothetical protein